MSTAYTINDAGFRSRMAQLVATARRPEGLMKACGREGRNGLVRHFRKRNASYASGTNHRGFWLEIARSVQNPMVNEAAGEVKISISDSRMNQKVFGGDITAKRARALTIPITDEAYGRRASVFEHETGHKLFVWHAQDGKKAFLAYSDADRLQLAYVLTPSVHQDRDPDALPDEGKMGEALIHRAEEVIKHQFAKI